MSEPKDKTKKKLIEENKKKEEEDRKKKLEDAEKEAQIRLRYELAKEKLKEEEDKLKEKKRQESITEQDTYDLNIFYTLENFSKPEKKYKYQGNKKNKFSIIEVNDEIQYNNPNHPNHLKYGIVRKFNKQGGTPKFEIVFNDPPFIWEKNKKTGLTVKTNKKIKIIQNVKFKNLIKKFNFNSIKMKLPISFSKIYKQQKFNKRNAFQKPILDKKMTYSKQNNILLMYKTLLFLNKLNLNYSFDSKNIPLFNKNFNIEDKLKKNKNDTLFEKIIKENLNDIKNNTIVSIGNNIVNEQERIKQIKKNQNTWHLLNINKFYYLFSYGENETENEKNFNSLLRVENDNHIIEHAFNLFNDILKIYGLKKDDFQLNNKIDIYKFYKNIIKKESDINKQKLFTFEDYIEIKINEIIEKEFIKNKIFYPEEVKVKYTNRTSLENENNYFNNPNILVKPTDDKIFTIDKYQIKKIKNKNDISTEYGKEEEVEKIFRIKKIAEKNSTGIIEVLLNIQLNMKDLKTKEEKINESVTDSAFRVFGDLLINASNKLNCEENNQEFHNNLKEIGKKFDKAFSVPKINTNEIENEETTTKQKLPIVTQFTPNLKTITNYNGGHKSIKNKSIKKNIIKKGGRKKSLKIRK